MSQKKIRTKTGRIGLALLLISALSVVGTARPMLAAYVPANLYQQAVLADNPLVYYPFEDANSNNGSTVADALETHDGTYQGGTVQGQGPHGVDGREQSDHGITIHDDDRPVLARAHI